MNSNVSKIHDICYTNSKILIYKHESEIKIKFKNDDFYIFNEIKNNKIYEIDIDYKINYLLLEAYLCIGMDIYFEQYLKYNLFPMDENNIYIILNRVSIKNFNNFKNNLSKYQKYTKLNLCIIYISNDYYENINIFSSDIFSQIVLLSDDYFNIKQISC